ncbi:hypothetical protein ACFWSF_11735 [Streptomyces sp. NPDC058611]
MNVILLGATGMIAVAAVPPDAGVPERILRPRDINRLATGSDQS